MAGYLGYLVLLQIFLGVVDSLHRGRSDTLITLLWPFGAPFLVLPSHWSGPEFPLFDNVCSLIGDLGLPGARMSAGIASMSAMAIFRKVTVRTASLDTDHRHG